MAGTDWDIDYVSEIDPEEEGNYIRVRIRVERGRVVDFVVQYEAEIDGRQYPIVRYDGSHGRGHRDLLDGDGETVPGGKQWLPEHVSMAEALEIGKRDLLDRWPDYRDAFVRRLR